MLEWENLKSQLCPFPYTLCEKVDFLVHLCIIVSPLLSDRLHNWYLHIVDRQDNTTVNIVLSTSMTIGYFHYTDPELKSLLEINNFLTISCYRWQNPIISLHWIFYCLKQACMVARGTKRIIIAIYLKMICSRRFLPLRRTHQHTKTAVSGNHYTTSSG